MLIAEDLLLLLTEPAEGRLRVARDKARLALAGALLVELEAAGRVTVDERGRLATLDPRPVGNELLDRALAILTGRQGRKPKDALPKVAKGLPEAGYHWLALRGAVARHEHRVLWVFPVVRHPVVGPELERIHSLTAEVLLGRVAPDLRSGALLALLEVVGAVPKVFAGVGGLSGRELRARARQVGAGDWASEAVRKAISDAEAAVFAATLAATTAATSSSS